MEVNKQRPEPVEHDAFGSTIQFINVWQTIQGEGPFAGTPAVFVRLAGCNIQCPACDTQYTIGRQSIPANVLAEKVLVKCRNNKSIPLVVITGGEPFRQNIRFFVEELYRIGKACGRPVRNIQIETNGTLCPPDFDEWANQVTVVCSPKASSIHPNIYPWIKALKYVVQRNNVSPLDGLPLTTLGRACAVARPRNDKPLPEIFVQPLDEQDVGLNEKNLEVALLSCYTFGYRLCLQTHKMIGLE